MVSESHRTKKEQVLPIIVRTEGGSGNLKEVYSITVLKNRLNLRQNCWQRYGQLFFAVN